MTIGADEIVRLYRQRKEQRGPIFAKMMDIRRHYQGEVHIPLPELETNEKAGIANWITQGIDQTAMRVASVMPTPFYPSTEPGNKKADEYARIRTQANTAWWQENRFDRKQRKRSRHLIAYALSPVVLHPDQKLQIPHWEVRDPLMTFPGVCSDPDGITPPDCIFAFQRSYDWLIRAYPSQMGTLAKPKSCGPDEMFDVLEYMDDEEVTMVVVGKNSLPDPSGWDRFNTREIPGNSCEILVTVINRIGRCPVVIPSRIGLERPQGQFDNMPGLYQLQARTMALFQIASERAIFPDLWAVSRPNETVQMLAVADGRAGIPGQIKGGDIKEITIAPSPQIPQLLQMLEQDQLKTASLSPEYGGQNPSAMRTARGGEQLLSATVDYWVQEAQETLGLSYMEENKIAVAIARTYFGNTKKTFYVHFKGNKSKGQVDYIPNVHFDTDFNEVSWPMVGSDANSQIISIGQRVGLKEMSIRTAQEMDPMIDDPEQETDRINSEALRQALLESVGTQAVQGQIGPLEIAWLIMEANKPGVLIEDAVAALHNKMQKEQAASAAQLGGNAGGGLPGGTAVPGNTIPQQPSGPGGVGSPGGLQPNSMPGLSAPGQQAAAQGVMAQAGVGPSNPPGQSVTAPTPSMQHFQQLLGALHSVGAR